ncbi:MAG: glgA2, partial [Clostridiales bacterium]|nr:glgA2 [Clostridiales bacterium]
FKDLKIKYPDKVSVYIGYNGDLAKRVYAGSDIFLMPSRFEPCGLAQIISLRYGTIPIVRATGGLADTIKDVEFDKENGNGFVFNEFSTEEFLKTVKRALRLYNQDKEFWETLVKRALTLDFSWKKPAEKYLKMYQAAISKDPRSCDTRRRLYEK